MRIILFALVLAVLTTLNLGCASSLKTNGRNPGTIAPPPTVYPIPQS